MKCGLCGKEGEFEFSFTNSERSSGICTDHYDLSLRRLREDLLEDEEIRKAKEILQKAGFKINNKIIDLKSLEKVIEPPGKATVIEPYRKTVQVKSITGVVRGHGHDVSLESGEPLEIKENNEITEIQSVAVRGRVVEIPKVIKGSNDNLKVEIINADGNAKIQSRLKMLSETDESLPPYFNTEEERVCMPCRGKGVLSNGKVCPRCKGKR